jgi:hypothetical protein
MRTLQNDAACRRPRNRVRQGSKYALGVAVFFILFCLPQETSTQPAALPQSEVDALRVRLSQCWKPPAGVTQETRGYVMLRVLLKPDGSLARSPVVDKDTSDLGPALANSAIEALTTCQPFTMLKPEHYEQWKDIEMKFDPHELLGR